MEPDRLDVSHQVGAVAHGHAQRDPVSRHRLKIHRDVGDHAERAFRPNDDVNQLAVVEEVIERVPGTVLPHLRKSRANRRFVLAQQRLDVVAPAAITG